jgi:hypothetical protein
MAFRDSAGGIANYKTPGKEVKMNGSTGMKKGGKVKESMMEKKMGKGMTKAKMQKKAKPKKMAYGGMAKKMKSGGAC